MVIENEQLKFAWLQNERLYFVQKKLLKGGKQPGTGLYQIANGHPRVGALRVLEYEMTKIFLTK